VTIQRRRNYYKNSPVQRRKRILRHFIFSLKMLSLLVTILGTSLLLILFHDTLVQSSYFSASRVLVEGNCRLTTAAILAQASVKPGDNILGTNLKMVRYRLLANPWIASAEVRRELPDTIHIRVSERIPLAKVELDRPYFLDSAGELVGAVDTSEQIEVPAVTGISFLDVFPEKPKPSKMFRAVMEVLHLSLAKGSVLPITTLNRIHADPDVGLTLFGFEEDVVIHLGFEDYHAKFDRLGHIINHFKGRDGSLGIDCIYLKDVDRVVVRPSEGLSVQKGGCRKGV
jgi:cell division protein FtsQ